MYWKFDAKRASDNRKSPNNAQLGLLEFLDPLSGSYSRGGTLSEDQ
jgi:hypothetical protein